MAAFNFPNSPSTNDLHTENGVTYKWNGTVWKRQNASYTDATNLNVTGISTFAGVIDAQGYINLAQKIIHTGDADTSIEFPSNDTIKFETAGSERLRITSDGKVGINETSPDRALHVTTTTDTEQIYVENTASSGRAQVRFVNPHGDWVTGLIGGTTDGDFITYTSAAKNFRVYTNTAERVRITSAGVLCVGATAADGDEFLRVKNKILVMNTANTGDAFVKIKAGESGGSVLEFEADEGDDYADLWRIQNAGDGLLGFRTKASGSWVQKLSVHNDKVMFSVDAKVDGDNTRDLGASGARWRNLHLGTSARIGATGTTASTAGDDLVIEGSSDRGISIISGSGSSANIYFGDSSDADIGRIAYQHNDNALDFSVNAQSTVVRIQNDGNLRWYPDGSSGVNLYMSSNNANAITYAAYKNGSVETSCHFKNQNSSGQAKTWMEVNGSQQISIPYGMGGTDFLNIYVGSSVTKGINIMGQDGGNQNSDSGRIHFNGYAQTNGPWIWGENTLAWGKKDLVFGTTSTTNDYTTEVSETLRMTKYGDVSFGISPNDTLWDSNNNEQGVYYRRSEGSFAMATRSSTGYSNWYMNKNTTGGNSDNRYIDFYWNNQTKGSITNSGGSSTSYNTSSDYRLKENIVDITDGITRLKQLKPRRFNWIEDSTNTLQDGFIAHEVSSLIPEAVTGTKDRVVTQAEVDADTQPQNDAVGTPVYQQMDYAKVTPLLTAALQEAIAKIETLEAEVAALKGS